MIQPVDVPCTKQQQQRERFVSMETNYVKVTERHLRPFLENQTLSNYHTQTLAVQDAAMLSFCTMLQLIQGVHDILRCLNENVLCTFYLRSNT